MHSVLPALEGSSENSCDLLASLSGEVETGVSGMGLVGWLGRLLEGFRGIFKELIIIP